MAKRTIPLADIRRDCHRLRDHLIATGGETAEALRLLEPGERDNPDAGPRGVLIWYGLLSQAFARDQVRAESHKQVDGKGEADAAAMAALAARPEVVSLVMSVGDKRAVEVHPKGLEALSIIRARDEVLAKLTAVRGVVAKSTAPDDVALTTRLDAELAVQLRVLVWAVTHEGPGLPFRAGDTPDPPEWTGNVSPWDALQIAMAHQRVNGKYLQALAKLTAPGETGNERPPWSVFLAAAGMELGIAPHVLLRDWSLVEVITAFRLSAESKRQAHESAKAKAKR